MSGRGRGLRPRKVKLPSCSTGDESCSPNVTDSGCIRCHVKELVAKLQKFKRIDDACSLMGMVTACGQQLTGSSAFFNQLMRDIYRILEDAQEHLLRYVLLHLIELVASNGDLSPSTLEYYNAKVVLPPSCEDAFVTAMKFGEDNSCGPQAVCSTCQQNPVSVEMCSPEAMNEPGIMLPTILAGASDRSSVSSEQKSERSIASSEHKTERSSVSSEQKSERSSASSEHKTERSSASSEHKTERSSASSEHKTERSSVSSEQKADRSSVSSEQKADRSSVSIEQKEPNNNNNNVDDENLAEVFGKCMESALSNCLAGNQGPSQPSEDLVKAEKEEGPQDSGQSQVLPSTTVFELMSTYRGSESGRRLRTANKVPKEDDTVQEEENKRLKEEEKAKKYERFMKVRGDVIVHLSSNLKDHLKDVFDVLSLHFKSPLAMAENAAPVPNHFNQKVKAYSREFLLECSSSAHSQKLPCNWSQLSEKYPEICLKEGKLFAADSCSASPRWLVLKSSNGGSIRRSYSSPYPSGEHVNGSTTPELLALTDNSG